MTMRSVHHTGIIVKDLDRSIYFYHDILGLDFVNEPSPWFEGDTLADAVGVPGAKLRQVSLQVGESAILELLEYANRPSDNDTPIQQNYLGAMHLAFHVEDIDAKVAELRAKGVHFLSDPNTVDEGVLAGWKWVYFHDPDEIPLELVEVRYYPEEERKRGIAEYLAHRPSLESLTP
ncbi:MAG: VOC family protein [Pontimonas sp.]|jgi:catechol 2,3-dioxygenase-like lactoylglutathione lyase family enzyme|nr:VOC family protein [Pontimonas sp.]